jgi:hypothetical protein
MRVVISQSMYFPWVGLLEQIRLADVFVHYDDVQVTRGFYNRVQVKTASGVRWMTVPLQGHHRGARIDEVLLDDSRDWRGEHRELLRRSFAGAPHAREALELFDQVAARPARTLADVSRASVLALAGYFGLLAGRRFEDAAALGVGGSSSRRLLGIVAALGGTRYLTGHGARNYLDHELFERSGVAVEYMAYRRTPYPQPHGEFTPHVTALDLVARCGRQGLDVIDSPCVGWRRFIHGTD